MGTAAAGQQQLLSELVSHLLLAEVLGQKRTSCQAHSAMRIVDWTLSV